MSARDEQADEWRHRVAMLERGGEQVRLHVVHTDHRQIPRYGDCLAEAHPHQKRPDQAGCMGNSHCFQILQRAFGLDQRLLNSRHQSSQVRARRQLRHNAAEHPMDVLRENDQRTHVRGISASIHDGGGRLITRSLDSEHPHCGNVSSTESRGDGVSGTRTLTRAGLTTTPSRAVSSGTNCGMVSLTRTTMRRV